MARHEIVMPQMGESITTGTITKWHKAAGDQIEIDEILLEISTDKVESEIPSPMEGRVEELHYEEGDTVDVGKVIAIIEDDLSKEFSGGGSTTTASNTEKVPEKVAEVKSSESAQSAPKASKSGERRFYTPLVKSMAEEHGVSLEELSEIDGSGAGGRVNKSDLESFLKSRQGVKAVTEPKSQSSSKPSTSSTSAAPAQTFDHGKRVEVIPMDNMRKAIARNMVQSKQTSPHVNSIAEVDMTNLVKQRNTIKDDFKKQEGFSLTFTHFILYAITQALKEFPLVNSSLDGDNIIMKKDINLGCAVAVPGNGLLVPVIKNADSLNLTGLARNLAALVDKARNKKLTMDDLTGGTYTFTNNGSFGVTAATPVILQPQVGIFCAGVIKKTPVVVGDNAIGIRDIMYATHTYDHRLIDGEQGSKFLMRVIELLQTMNITEIL